MNNKLIKNFPALSKSQQPKHPTLRGLLIPNYWSYAVIDMNILYNHPNFIHAKIQIGNAAANIMKKLLSHKILKNISRINNANNYTENYLINAARQGLHEARSASLISNKNGYHLTKLGTNLIRNSTGYVNQYNQIIKLVNAGKISSKKNKYRSRKSKRNGIENSSINLKFILKFILKNYLSKKHKYNHLKAEGEIKSGDFKKYNSYLYLDKNHFRISSKDKTDKAKLNKINAKNTIFKNSIGNLHVECSAGNGNWAQTPWIRIYNKHIAPKPTKGLYLVYLFSTQMKCVCLALAEGVTNFKNKKYKNESYKLRALRNYSSTHIHLVDQIIKNNNNIKSSMATNGMNDRIIYGPQEPLVNKTQSDKDLRKKSFESKYKLPLEYKAGTIAYIKYSLLDFKNLDNSTFLQDLHIMCDIYNQAPKERLLNDQSRNETRKNKSIQQLLENYKNADVISGKRANPKTLDYKPNHSKGPKKPNYDQEHKYHTGLGQIGEQKVIDYEKRKLRKANKPELAAKVNSESEKNDRAGYDINSFFKDSGKRLDIEVKTTSATSNTKSFHITQNEWNHAKKHAKNYRLYFLHATKRKNGKVDFQLCKPYYTFNDLNKLYKEVVSYIIYPGYKK